MVESSDRPRQRRRPGPVAFNAEPNVTKLNLGDAPNPGGIGSATPLRKETPTGSKELRVKGPVFWFVIGLVLVVLGLFSSIGVAGIGVAICVGSVMGSRMNRTSRRLRKPVRETGDAAGSGSTE